MRQLQGAPASPSGSHPSGHAAPGVDGAARFDPSRMEALAHEIEAATWADPALARQVGEATKGFRVRPDWNPLAWIDEAMTLVPWGRRRVEFGIYDGGRAWAYVHTPADVVGESDDAPLEAAAITAAALRAIATEARRAETVQLGSVHEGAGRQASPENSNSPSGDTQ